MTDAATQAPLFDVGELTPDPGQGRAEAALQHALAAAVRAQVVLDVDAGLVAGALIAARALDQAERIASPKDRAYAVTALLPPYQKALHGLRLPAEVTPAGAAPSNPAGADSGPPSWMGDAFGPS